MPLPSPATRPGVPQSLSTRLAACPADRGANGDARRTCTTPLYTRSFPCTCIRIFSRSSGATAVRDLPRIMSRSAFPTGRQAMQQRPHSGECAAASGCEPQGSSVAVATQAWLPAYFPASSGVLQATGCPMLTRATALSPRRRLTQHRNPPRS